MSTALLVVDMLNDFVDGTLANPASAATIAPIARLADEARRAGWPVIYGNDAHQSGDLEFKVFGEHAVAGSKGAEVIPRLAPVDGDLVVPKRSTPASRQPTSMSARRRSGGPGWGGDGRADDLPPPGIC